MLKPAVTAFVDAVVGVVDGVAAVAAGSAVA